MSLTWLKAFHLVAQEGSFTAASNKLHVSQPTVSSHVKALERHFKVELFFRKGSQIELTPFGKSLSIITAGLFGHEEEALTMLRLSKNFEEGELKLSAVGPFDVMSLIAELKQRYQKMKIAVALGSASEVLQLIADYKSDVALLARRVESPEYFCVPFRRHRVLAITSRTGPLGRKFRSRISLQDLVTDKMIMREPESTTRLAFEGACNAAQLRPDVLLEINSREAIVRAVALGLGSSVIAESEMTYHPELRVLALTDAEIFVHSYLVCLSERRNRPIIKTAFDVAAKMVMVSQS
jgi:aminoethylphosphonate catabolism LysR family transcriptional regulator